MANNWRLLNPHPPSNQTDPFLCRVSRNFFYKWLLTPWNKMCIVQFLFPFCGFSHHSVNKRDMWTLASLAARGPQKFYYLMRLGSSKCSTDWAQDLCSTKTLKFRSFVVSTLHIKAIISEKKLLGDVRSGISFDDFKCKKYDWRVAFGLKELC